MLRAEGPGSAGASIEFELQNRGGVHVAENRYGYRRWWLQAGLAITYLTLVRGREHVVLERAPAVANAWRNQRWDSFTLVTSNFQIRMPGAEYSGSDPYGFMSLAEVIEYFDNYAERFRLPVLCGVEVFSVEKVGDRYVVRTSEKNYETKNVVIATGLYQSPKIPPFSTEIPPSVLQLHSMKYKTPLNPSRGCSARGGNRAVGSADCPGTLSEWKESLSLDRQCRTCAPTISRQGYH